MEEIEKIVLDRIDASKVELNIFYRDEEESGNVYELYTKRRKCYLLGIEVPFSYEMRFDNSNKTRQEKIKRWRENREKKETENKQISLWRL